MFDELRATEKLDVAVEQAAKNQPQAVQTDDSSRSGAHDVVGFRADHRTGGRFERSKQVVSYLGLNPQEHSSGGKQRLGSISKQGNPMMRSLLVEAGHTAARLDPALKRMYQRLKFRRGASVAKVADGPQAGREDVLDAAQHGGLCAARSHARQPVGHPGGKQSIAGLIGRLAPRREGSLNNESWSDQRPNRWLVERASTAGF